MKLDEFISKCLSGNSSITDTIKQAIIFINEQNDFEKNAEYISRISQQIIINKVDECWQDLLRLCELAEIKVISTEAKSYVYKAFMNYYNEIGLSSKVIEYALKYEKLNLPDEKNYEVFSMAAFSLYETGFYNKAIEYTKKSQEAIQKIDLNNIFNIISYNNLVYCYDAVGRTDLMLETYSKFRLLIETHMDVQKKSEFESVFKMCTFFVKMKTNIHDENMMKGVFDDYIIYISQLEKISFVGIMENEDVHLPFIDYVIEKKEYKLAIEICRKLLKIRNISGEKKQIYKRLIKVYKIISSEVSKQEIFDTVLDYNIVLEKYNDKFDRIMHELVNEQFRISEIEDKYNELQNNYQIDALTNCLNRKALEMHLIEQEKNKKSGTIIFIDLDYLKRINDTYGHNSGDVYLRYFSYLSSNVLANDAKLYRYGGDEFVIVIEGNSRKALDLVDKMKEAFITPCKLIDNDVKLQFSFGIAEFGDNGIRMENAIQMADKKMYENKKDKRRS